MEPSKLSLSKLPPLILAEVTNLLHGGAIVALFCTGNLPLLNVMANGGVERVKFEIKAELCAGKFPTCLASFRGLRSLKIGAVGHLGPSVWVGSQLRRLSPTLESLSLRFQDSALVFYESRPSTLARLFFESEADESPLWSLEEYFPALRSFSLDAEFDAVAGFTPAHLTILPKSLTKLYLPRWCKLPIEYLTTLPRDLVKLRLPRSMQLTKREEIEALPHTLNKLVTACHISEDLLELLPSSVTYLGLFTAELTPQRVRALPRHLFECRFRAIENFGIDHLLALPPYLIIFHIHGLSFRFSSEALKALPQTLTELSMSAALDLPPIPHSPNSESDKGSSDTNMALESGIMVNGETKPSEDQQPAKTKKPIVCPFPATLRILSLSTFSLALTEYLPSHLISLSSEELEWTDHSAHYIKLLPPDMTSLSISFVPSLKLFGAATNFPRRLVRFKIALQDPDDVEDLKIYPRTMTSKILLSMSKIEDVHIAWLPSQIQHLNISNARNLTPLCFQFLPRSLVRLRMSVNGVIEIRHSRHLPKYLELLHLSEIDDFTDEAIEALPRGLLELALPSLVKNCIEPLKHLPPYIERFMALKWSATLDVIEYIPRSLRMFLVSLPTPTVQDVAWLHSIAPPLCRFAFGFLDSIAPSPHRAQRLAWRQIEAEEWEPPVL